MGRLFTIVKGVRPSLTFSKVGLLIGFAIIVLLLPFSVLFLGNKDRIYEISVIEDGDYDVAIVLGAGVDKDGNLSNYLEDRLDRAVELYESGKIKQILVSGNNSDGTNNETDVMMQYLLDNDIPDFAILEDPLGARTYDTCARAKEVYGLNKVILISQKFHLFRSIAICNELGVKSIGVSASDGFYSDGWFYSLREILADHRAIYDMYLAEPGYSKELY